MNIPYYPHSGRRKHYWRMRTGGHRDLLIEHRWSLTGGYCKKYIKGRSVMLSMVTKNDDYCVVCVCDENGFWALATAKARAHEAEQRRKAFRVLEGGNPDNERNVLR